MLKQNHNKDVSSSNMFGREFGDPNEASKSTPAGNQETNSALTNKQSVPPFSESSHKEPKNNPNEPAYDLEQNYALYAPPEEADYNGWDEQSAVEGSNERPWTRDLNAYKLRNTHEVETNLIEQGIKDGDIAAIIVDSNGVETGFVLCNYQHDYQEYLYVEDEGCSEAETRKGYVRVKRTLDNEIFDLHLTCEEIDDYSGIKK